MMIGGRGGSFEVTSSVEMTISDSSTIMVLGKFSGGGSPIRLNYARQYSRAGTKKREIDRPIIVANETSFNGTLVVAANFSQFITATSSPGGSATSGPITFNVMSFNSTDGSQFDAVQVEPAASCEVGTATPRYEDRRLDILITLDTSRCPQQSGEFPAWAIAIIAVGGAIVVVGAILGLAMRNEKCRRRMMPYRGTKD
jgi:hypothetical protein